MVSPNLSLVEYLIIVQGTSVSFIVRCSGVGSISDGSSVITGATNAIVSTSGINARFGAIGWRCPDMIMLEQLSIRLGTQLFCMVHMYVTAPDLPITSCTQCSQYHNYGETNLCTHHTQLPNGDLEFAADTHYIGVCWIYLLNTLCS